MSDPSRRWTTPVGAIRNLLRSAAKHLLRLGPLPQHVAFIMDGNRRFAARLHLDPSHGHCAGYQRMMDTLEWCFDLGIHHVSVYAFSVDNFSRSSTEVDSLMNLAEGKLLELLAERDLLMKHGIRIQVVGRLDLLPRRVQVAAARAMEATRRHVGGVLNICLCYTARHEMSAVVGALRRGNLSPASLTNPLFDSLLGTAPSPPVDLMLRTSGETRLSDFLVRQCATAHLCFLPVLWPDLAFRHFAKAILSYQEAHDALIKLRCCVEAEEERAIAVMGEVDVGRVSSIDDNPLLATISTTVSPCTSLYPPPSLPLPPRSASSPVSPLDACLTNTPSRSSSPRLSSSCSPSTLESPRSDNIHPPSSSSSSPPPLDPVSPSPSSRLESFLVTEMDKKRQWLHDRASCLTLTK